MTAKERLIIRLARIMARLCGIPVARYDAEVARFQALSPDAQQAEYAKAFAELANGFKKRGTSNDR
mgnify:CR=1 FL=1